MHASYDWYIAKWIFYFLFIHFIQFLLKATETGHIEIVKELLTRNANIEAKDENGWTPLMIGILLNGFFIFYSSI